MGSFADWSVSIFAGGKFQCKVDFVRDNRHFGALKDWLRKKQWNAVVINFYYQGSFMYQEKWKKGINY
jgi:hypothetical protein